MILIYSDPNSLNHDDNDCKNKEAMKKFLVQLAGHRNFLLFTAMNLVQVDQIFVNIYLRTTF